MQAVTVKNLTFRYPETGVDVLRDISFSVESGAFVTLCGLSGSGKSTLLRHLKPALTPFGVRSGEVLLDGKPIGTLSPREQSERIGFVQQSPDNQLVTDKVWHELSFGLENLGLKRDEISRRVAETASFFGIQNLFEAQVQTLSGGQKQLVNLAAVMAMQPQLLLLDEPTAQLDPIAAAEFLACLQRVNRELGVTVIITEHRLDGLLPMSDRVLVLEDGRLISDDIPSRTGGNLRRMGSGCFLSLPAPMRIWDAVADDAPCPVTIAEGRAWLHGFAQTHDLHPLEEEAVPPAGETVIALQHVWFRYEKNAPDVLRNLSIEVKRGELLTIMGGNGTGKSTLLSLLSGSRKPYSGKCISNNELILTLPQEPQALFTGKTVWEMLAQALENSGIPQEEREERIKSVVRLCQINGLTARHPFDLSGGEMQKAALAKLLLLRPQVLLLDEPTKGLDAQFKAAFASILQKLVRQGTAVVMISHDMEFCARYSHRCLLLFNGDLVAGGTPRTFFGGNSFYVTAASRMARELIPQAVTAEDVIFACTGQKPETPDNAPDRELPIEIPVKPEKKPLPFWKKLLGGAGLLLLAAGIAENLTPLAQALPLWANLVFVAVPVVLLMIAFGAKSQPPVDLTFEKQKLRKRTIAAVVIVVLLIPFTIFAGVTWLQDQKYLFISLLVLIEGLLPFFMLFEGHKPQARELVLIAVLCALTVAGRSVFAALPQVKPVLALVIICGAALGGETGFIVGATSMLLSNIFFGQGAWTPWQMFAAGCVGLLAGILFRRGHLLRGRGSVCVFGFVATVVIYGGIMNFSSLVLSHAPVNVGTVCAYILQGLPFDLIHGFSTAAFLYFFALPMLEKFSRIQIKYGLISGSAQAV